MKSVKNGRDKIVQVGWYQIKSGRSIANHINNVLLTCISILTFHHLRTNVNWLMKHVSFYEHNPIPDIQCNVLVFLGMKFPKRLYGSLNVYVTFIEKLCQIAK